MELESTNYSYRCFREYPLMSQYEIIWSFYFRTTLAHKLKGDKGAVFSLEEFFTTSNGYQFNPKKVNDARKWNQERALKAIEVSPLE